MRVAFYAPLKGPDHPVPSGDRQMARLLLAALRAGGHEVEIASSFRSFLSAPEPRLQAGLEAQAQAEVFRIADRWDREANKPDLWFTYHAYYKAPDFLGPRLAEHFGLPYATAEASHAEKRRHGPWARWHAANEAAIRAGAVHFCFTEADREGLEPLIGPAARILALPPFIDAAPFRATAPTAPGPAVRTDGVELATMAMMRPGAKSRSYLFLAQALAGLPPSARWRLTVIGDGPARQEVRAMFAGLPADRIVWRGELGPAEIAATLGRAEVFLWPGYDEAYGMSYLEAGAAGLAVLAMRSGGISSVVRHGTTGLLTREGDLGEYTAMLAMLIDNGGMRRRLGGEARRFVTEERTVPGAAAILSEGLRRALTSSPAEAGA